MTATATRTCKCPDGSSVSCSGSSAVRGADSGHPASATDVEIAAKSYTAALDNTRVTVITTWSPENRSGSTVQVKVSYDFGTVLTPLASSNVLTVQTTAREIISQ
jgi:hypothetical protein